MKNRIPYTYLAFDLPLFPNHLRAFRGAVIENVMHFKPVFEAAAISTDIFHNHLELAEVGGAAENKQEDRMDTQFRYPLIQYKVRHKKAAILGLGPGAQALQLWMSLAGEYLDYKGTEIPLSLDDHRHGHWAPELGDKVQHFRLNKWLPFNAQHFQKWKHTPKLTDRVQLLEKLIWGHLWQALDGLELRVERRSLQVYLSTIDMMSFKDSFGIKRLALDVTFGTNLNLPEEIGLGQGVSIGFGKVQQLRSFSQKNER
ncbi:hypothetical protein SAMN05192553_11810 [Cyclobacterium xiamenense]|uniref:Uncharacterized protein n=1 Tax=Cyclobacterium xiamenense TaxID=1297121 RepID=A0A1H7BWW2_9BACT|nr:CRISPR-associated endonuclease Cas6 [Cyclobacterium xiamenense]SEJ81888.1 hypothetical protein SAMN05192553_11810 [Cyclobacterium xiamenense]